MDGSEATPIAPAAHTPRPPPWVGLHETDPFAVFPERCASFDEDGMIASYADGPDFVRKAEGTWTRDGDRIRMEWIEKTSTRGYAPEGQGDEEGKMWTETEVAESATLVLHTAWEEDSTEDDRFAVILASSADPTCGACTTAIACSNTVSHEGGDNGDTWFGPSEPPDLWVQVIDAGGGAAAADEVGALVARSDDGTPHSEPHLGIVFPGPPAKNPRTGIEVLHREGPRSTALAATIAVKLGVLSSDVRTVPWPDAPHPIVVAVGPLDRWSPDLVPVDLSIFGEIAVACPSEALRGDRVLYFRPSDLPVTCTITSGTQTASVPIRNRGELECHLTRIDKELDCTPP